MASYLTGLMIALVTVFGLHFAIEGSSRNFLFQQDKLGALTTTELLELANDSQSPDQILAILQLGYRPGKLSKTVPALAEISVSGQKDMVRQAAGMALREIGEPAVEFIRPLLESNDTRDNAVACSAIRSIGKSCKVFLPELKKCVLSGDFRMRRCGLFALQGLGGEALDALDELIVCIETDTDFNNQCSACRVIEKLGPDAAKAQSALIVLLDKGNLSTRGWAAVCLGAIGNTDSGVDVGQLLADKLKERRFPAEIQRILLGLANLGPEGVVAADEIRKWSTNWDNYVKSHCAYALWRVTEKSDESLAILDKVLAVKGHEDDALELLAKMGRDSLPLLQSVIPFLGSPEPNTRELALIVIGNIGPPARNAIPHVKPLLTDSDAIVRVTAKQTLLDLQ